MTSKEYTNTSDLKTVRIARTILQGLVPAINPAIPAEELEQVHRLLAGWEERMAGKVRIRGGRE